MARFPKIVDITKGYNKKAIQALKAARDEEARLAAELSAIERLDLPNTQLADQLKTIKLPDVPEPPKSGFEMVGSPYINDSALVPMTGSRALVPEVLDAVPSNRKLPDIEVDNLSAKLNNADLPLTPQQIKLNKMKAGLAALGAGGAGAALMSGVGSSSNEMALSPAVPQNLQEDINKQVEASVKPSEQEKTIASMQAKLSRENANETAPTSQTKEINFGDMNSIANLQRLQELQEGSRKARLTNELGRAAMAAVTMAGNTQNPFDQILSSQAQAADKIPEDYLKQVAFEKEDPNSPMSKGYRDIAKSLGFNIKGQASAADLERLMPQLANIYNQEQGQIARREMAKESRLARQDELALRMSMMKDQKSEQKKGKFVEYAQKAIGKEFEKLQKVENAVDAIEAAKEDQMGPADVQILYNFIKSQDPESVVREGEIALGQRGMSLAGRLRTATIGQFNGELLDPQFRSDILKISRRLKDQGGKSYQQAVQTIRDTGTKMYGLNEDDLALIDPVLNREQKAKQQAVPQASPVGKSGLTPEQRQARIQELRSKQGAQ